MSAGEHYDKQIYRVVEVIMNHRREHCGNMYIKCHGCADKLLAGVLNNTKD